MCSALHASEAKHEAVAELIKEFYKYLKSVSLFFIMAFRRFKRSRRSLPKRALRFRRTFRKRVPKTSTFTSQKGTASRGVDYKHKRFNRRAFSKRLWNSTLDKTHWRSYQTVTGSANTNASAALMQISFVDPFTNGAFFWTSAGGAQPTDTGGSVPLFSGDIILRGGKWSLTYCNTSATDTIKMTVWYTFTVSRPDTSIIPTTAGPGWDPSMLPDFATKYGKIMRTEQVLLAPLQTWEYQKRLFIRKFDQYDAASLLGNTPVLLFGLENCTQNALAAGFLKHTLNVSFSGDAIGTT